MGKIAIPLASDFEDVEFTIPSDELKKAGHQITVIGSQAGEAVKGKRGQVSVRTDIAVAGAEPEEFDAVVIPGGYSPDHLRMDAKIVEFVRRFAETGKLIAAVCHGPQLLIEADLVRGRTMTSWPSVRKDLQNAGANWVDREVVEDGQFITARKPDDLQAFSKAIVNRLQSRLAA